ncbi:MAG: SDR family NAD(P)-dependent oxidoreductase [Lachnospiraceae bacterium]|nr:MAG: SDR family NAD(P)-dependent oxidoreductase [Lachnospiraceae bacterium]
MGTKTKWAVITGASSGIGEEFAYRFYDMGYSLVLISQTREKLSAVEKHLLKRKKKAPERRQEIKLIDADLGEMGSLKKTSLEIKKIFQMEKFTEDSNLPAILINCAGFGAVGEFTDISIEKQESMIDVNVKGLVYLTYEMLPIMEAAGGGRILNVASSAGFFPGGPYMTIYYATKSFVLSFTNGLRRELFEKKSPVHISALCPGPVNTPFNARANVRNALPGISAKRCVSAAISGMKHDKAVIVPGITIKAAELGAKILPAKAVIPMVSHQQKKKI